MKISLKASVFVAAVLSCAAGDAGATALEDANAAVLAARQGKYDDAIQLFTSAINSDELNLKSRAQAYSYRGVAKATAGDYDGAEEDLNSAVALASEYNADALAYRGYLRMVRGHAPEAAIDLAKSAGEKVWAYNALWLHLARLKANIPDTDHLSLANNAATLKKDAWPFAVVQFLMGQATREQVVALSKEGDPTRLVERVCDADFYVAEFDLAKGDAAAAKPMLQNAAGKCPYASFERMGATAELARLK